jgi:hypothetical protein
MKVLNFLKNVVVKGGPAIAALVLGSPETAVVLASASVAADGTKIAGKKLEDKTGWSPHKVASPAAAVLGGAGAAALVAKDLPAEICAMAARLCEQPELLATIPGIAMILWQTLAQGATRIPPPATDED